MYNFLKNTMKSLRSDHERALNDLRNEHLALLKSVKSQLTTEKENAVQSVREEYYSEKGLVCFIFSHSITKQDF